MKHKICNTFKALTVGLGLTACIIHALAAQSTKSWDNFIPNILLTIAIIAITALIVAVIDKFDKTNNN